MKGLAPSAITPHLHAFLNSVWNVHLIHSADAQPGTQDEPVLASSTDPVDLTPAAEERGPNDCPPMPHDFAPSSLVLVLADGPVTVQRECIGIDNLEQLAEVALELRAELWVEMWKRGWVQHDMTEDPRSHRRFCARCQAPEWQVLAGTPCKKGG